ncbi:MAG TPA: polyketide synthase dehydratase domain-containing protein, partial [Calditrichia bacterium]|nr:polyketide synthase dehydratase domain-containing protein [Calditrichia bacterium]
PLIQGTLFDTQITPQTPAFLGDHRVWGTVVLPAAAYLETALSAAAVIYGTRGAVELHDAYIQEAFVLPDDNPRTLQLHLSENQPGRNHLEQPGAGQRQSGGIRRQLPQRGVLGRSRFA